MDSKRRYKICICSVILEELESFLNYKGWSNIFLKILDENWMYYESETFSDTKRHHIFESANLRFLLSSKNSLTWEVRCEN